MVRIQGSTVIARPVEDVFDFVADERNEPKYNPRMTRAEKVTPGPVAKGTRWSATIESRGRPLDMKIEVTDYIRPTRLGSTTSMSTAEINGAVTFEPDPAGTRLSWSWELQPRGLFRVMGPLIARIGRRQEAEIWAGLKSYLESTAPPVNGHDDEVLVVVDGGVGQGFDEVALAGAGRAGDGEILRPAGPFQGG